MKTAVSHGVFRAAGRGVNEAERKQQRAVSKSCKKLGGVWWMLLANNVSALNDICICNLHRHSCAQIVYYRCVWDEFGTDEEHKCVHICTRPEICRHRRCTLNDACTIWRLFTLHLHTAQDKPNDCRCSHAVGET